VRDAHERVTKLIDVAPVDVDLPEFVDALVDLDYVIEGARVACGVYGEPVEAAVHHANMEKGEGPLRADGKKEKPPGWKPPDVAALLRAQGWQHPRQGSSLPSLDDMPLPPVPGPEAP
jgi:predicted HAD superfamily Cof-like phosphohydrolase